MHPTEQRCRGYSLVELLVVLAIIGILAVVTLVYRADNHGPAVKGVVQEIQIALLDARTLSRNSGGPITVVPSGTARNASLNYVAASGPSGSYNLGGDSSAFKFAEVDFSGADEPTASALTSLRTSLEGVTITGATVFAASIWATNGFNVATPLIFNSNGTASREVYIAVVAHREGLVIPNGPVGIILVNGSGNIFRYFRKDSTSQWVKL